MKFSYMFVFLLFPISIQSSEKNYIKNLKQDKLVINNLTNNVIRIIFEAEEHFPLGGPNINPDSTKTILLPTSEEDDYGRHEKFYVYVQSNTYADFRGNALGGQIVPGSQSNKVNIIENKIYDIIQDNNKLQIIVK